MENVRYFFPSSVISSDCQHCVLNSLSNRTLSGDPRLATSMMTMMTTMTMMTMIPQAGCKHGSVHLSTPVQAEDPTRGREGREHERDGRLLHVGLED